jgi:hypothetical protein
LTCSPQFPTALLALSVQFYSLAWPQANADFYHVWQTKKDGKFLQLSLLRTKRQSCPKHGGKRRNP